MFKLKLRKQGGRNDTIFLWSQKAENRDFLQANVGILLFFFQVRERSQVTALSSSQQEQLLRAVEQSDTFHRRMTAHSILYNLHFFLVDCKRVIVNKRATKAREAAGSRLLTAVTFYQQKLKM